MERISDSDSDDDDTYRHVGSLVLRPAITNLPSIGDDDDTDGGDSSNEAEVVFSNINWAAQDSAGLLFDQELVIPGSSTLAVDTNLPTGSKASHFGANSGTDSDSDALSVARAGADEAALPQDVTPRLSAADRVGGEGPAGMVDPDESYEGRGWLAGVAGRLANTAERRRAYAAATDAEQVADAAKHAAALWQHRLQQRGHNHEAARAGGISPYGIITAGDAAGSSMVTEMELQQQSQREREEVEQLILRDFYEAIRAAESEPPLVAPAGLSLESSVAGLGVDDLDALIDRLTTGTANLRAADSQGPAAAAGAGRDGVGGGAGSQWLMQPLPAADSLWSDDEDERRIVQYGKVQPPAVADGRREWKQPLVEGLLEPRQPQEATATAAAAPAAAAVVTETRGLQAAGQAVSGSSSLPATAPLAGPLPAKFKFFAGPGGPLSTAPHLPLPPRGPSTASVGIGNGGGPVVQDLRQSIKDTVQRHSREAAAAAAQRESQAKAAAARRRLTASSDGSSPGGSSDDDNAATVKKIRPAPPALAPRTPESGLCPETAPPARPPLPSASRAAALLQAPPGAATAAVMPFTESAVESIGGAVPAAATVRCTSVGTDSADLRPASRSVFVCTTERKAEEEERARDIREYLKARAAAVEQQRLQERETSAVEVETPVSGERSWPEPPTMVAERIAVLAERKAAAAAAAAAPKAGPTRVVSTFTGGRDVGILADGTHGNGSLSANGHMASPLHPQPVIRPVADVGAPETASWAFAACSTEGDEDLVAAPTPASVSDASTEAGARVAAAGTIIALATVSPSGNSNVHISSDTPAPRTASNAQCEVMSSTPLGSAQEGRASLGRTPRTSESSLMMVPPAAETWHNASPTPALSATAATTGSNSADSPAVGPSGVPPTALQVPSPPSVPHADADSTVSALPHVSPVAPCSLDASSANAMATPPAKSPGATAGAPSDLCFLPAWLPQGSCFTLLVTSPRNLTSVEIVTLLEWLLLRTSVTPKLQPQLPQLPTFSIVGARLLAVQPSWPLLPTAAAEAAMAMAPHQTGGEVRVLAVACVPRPGVDPDAYSHELPATAAADAATAAAAAQQFMGALAAMPWSALVAVDDESLGDGAQVRDRAIASGISRNRELLGGWVSTHAGAQLLFSPLRLRAHAFSQCQPRPSSSGVAVSPTAAGSHAAAVGTPGAAITAVVGADGPGISTFVSVVTAGGLRDPHLLRRLVGRAVCLGLTLRGLQVVYATEEAAAAVVAATPHRPLPYTGAAILALSGRNEALRRWQATLGPPDARMACRTEPSSLHALYGDVARHITCSYDSVTATRELSVLFGVTAIGDSQLPSSPLPSPRQQRHQARPQPQPAPPSALHKGPAAGPEAVLAAVKSLVGSGTLEAQWLALPAAGALQQANSLWCLHHLLWCGYSLRGLLMMCLPGEPHTSPPAFVFEVTKEEAIEQLPLLLAAIPPRPQSSTLLDGELATITNAQHSLLQPGALAARLASSDVQGLPQPYIAEQLLVAAAGDAALDPAEDRDGYSGGGYVSGGADSGSGGMTALHLHHGEDGIAVVALQSRPLDAAALLLAALTAHATGCGGGTATSTQPPDRLELVACRYLRQVPSDVANCLRILHPSQGSAAAASAEGGIAASGGGIMARGAHRLVISHPALIAVFHGPSAPARVARWLAAGLQRLHGSPEQAIGVAAPSSDDSAWEALLNHLRENPLPTGSTPPLPLVAISSSQANARRALSYSFGPSHVFLDAGMHDGLHRPPLPAAPEAVSSSTASTEAAVGTPLFRLLAGPEPLPAVVALDFIALHRNLLPRLLKQLWREGYVMHAATTCRVQQSSATAAALPALSDKPAVLLHVSRSNAIQHLRAMAGALATPLTGGSAGGLYVCATWHDAVAVLADVWPQSSLQTSSHGPTAPTSSGSGVDGCALAGRSAIGVAGGLGTPVRRFVRPEGSRLLQLTTMVVTPSGPASGESTPALDWPHVADALEALHSEGFRLGAIRAIAATPRDMLDLGRFSCRISSSQQYAIHTSAAAAAATTAAEAARSGHSLMVTPEPCNLVLLALARDSAVTSLQVLLDEAGRAAGEVMRQGPGQLQGIIPGPGVLSALTGRGPGRREAVAALAAVAPCISVAHSPAAAEQQIAAVFEDVFGAGGVPLLQ